MRDRSLFHMNRRSQGRGIEKKLCDYGRQTDAPVRSGIGWDVTLVHGVTAFEKHGERHARAVETRAGRAPILARIDIRDDDIAQVVHVIAEPARDVVLVFPNHAILPGRGGKAGLARGNRRFADERFALEEIGALFPDADNDSGLAGGTVTVPGIRHGSRSGCRTGGPRRRHFRAAGQEGQDGKSERAADQGVTGHKDAHSNSFGSVFNPKDFAVITAPARVVLENMWSASGYSCPGTEFLIASAAEETIPCTTASSPS
jgi:hypothetical protein